MFLTTTFGDALKAVEGKADYIVEQERDLVRRWMFRWLTKMLSRALALRYNGSSIPTPHS
jgi:hypothetical protein